MKNKFFISGLCLSVISFICGCVNSNKDMNETESNAATNISVFVSEATYTSPVDEEAQTEPLLRFVSVENYGIVANIWELSYVGEAEPCYHFEYRHSSTVLFSSDVTKERGDKVFDMFMKADKDYPIDEEIGTNTETHYGYIGSDERLWCSLSPEDFHTILTEMLSIKEDTEEAIGIGADK